MQPAGKIGMDIPATTLFRTAIAVLAKTSTPRACPGNRGSMKCSSELMGSQRWTPWAWMQLRLAALVGNQVPVLCMPHARVPTQAAGGSSSMRFLDGAPYLSYCAHQYLVFWVRKYFCYPLPPPTTPKFVSAGQVARFVCMYCILLHPSPHKSSKQGTRNKQPTPSTSRIGIVRSFVRWLRLGPQTLVVGHPSGALLEPRFGPGA